MPRKRRKSKGIPKNKPWFKGFKPSSDDPFLLPEVRAIDDDHVPLKRKTTKGLNKIARREEARRVEAWREANVEITKRFLELGRAFHKRGESFTIRDLLDIATEAARAETGKDLEDVEGEWVDFCRERLLRIHPKVQGSIIGEEEVD